MPLRSITETYDYLRRIAPMLSQQLAQAAAQAHNEAELREIQESLKELE
jgi:hypothetical protein